MVQTEGQNPPFYNSLDWTPGLGKPTCRHDSKKDNATEPVLFRNTAYTLLPFDERGKVEHEEDAPVPQQGRTQDASHPRQ